MKANELRIGNLVHFFKDTPAMAVAISSHTLYLTQGGGFINPKTEECVPIPLTDEWLLRFGFEKSGRFYRLGALTIEVRKTYFRVCLCGNFLVNLLFVHKLQNLYFALTGEELKLKHDENN